MEKIISIRLTYSHGAYQCGFTELDKLPENAELDVVFKNPYEYSVFIKFAEMDAANLVIHESETEEETASRKASAVYDNVRRLVKEREKDLKDNLYSLGEFEYHGLKVGGAVNCIYHDFLNGRTRGGFCVTGGKKA